MSEAVVDRLEVVEVDEHHRDLRDVPRRAHQGVLDAIGEECAIGELRDGVVEGLVCELVLERLALADVATVQHQAANVLVVEQIGVLHLESENRTVAMKDGALDRVTFAVSGAVGGQELSEKRTIARADQTVESRALDVVDAVAEHGLRSKGSDR